VLVVMVKRERGFNPKANDWEFLTVSGDLKKIEKREKEGKCRDCHASETSNDFVFRYTAP
jgi:Cytochrome P460